MYNETQGASMNARCVRTFFSMPMLMVPGPMGSGPSDG